jgi:hypothetical protein
MQNKAILTLISCVVLLIVVCFAAWLFEASAEWETYEAYVVTKVAEGRGSSRTHFLSVRYGDDLAVTRVRVSQAEFNAHKQHDLTYVEVDKRGRIRLAN